MILYLDKLDNEVKENLGFPTVAENLVCTVKWFCKKKGYGFISPGINLSAQCTYLDSLTGTEISDSVDFFNALKAQEHIIEPINHTEIFLHLSRVGPASLLMDINIKAGDILICKIVRNSRGLHVSDTFQYFASQKTIKDIIVCSASVKWFNKEEDFGFLRADSAKYKQDIFLSGKKVRESEIDVAYLIPKAKVICSFVVENNKPVVIKLALD